MKSIIQNNKIQLKSLILESSLTCFHQIGFEKIFTGPVIITYNEGLPSLSLEELVVNIRYYFSSSEEEKESDYYDTHKERIMLYEDLSSSSKVIDGIKKLELSFLGFFNFF